MKSIMYRLILIILGLSGFYFNASGQQQDSVYISNNDSVFVHNYNDTVSIYGSVYHNGVVGSTTGSYVYFMGFTWKNSKQASFPLLNSAKNDGGIFCFQHPLLNNYSQVINGGFNRKALSSGPIFPNIEIANSSNVYLDSTDVAVSNIVKMDTGLVYMSANAGGLDNTQNSFVLGGGSLTPRIVNYSRDKYFVSGVLSTDTSYLYIRNIVSTDTAVFPVGSKSKDFTPAGVTAMSGDIMVRAFDGVYQNGASGSLISDPFYIQKTWQVLTPLTTKGSYNLLLQHHLNNETSTFANNRSQSYIALNNGNSSWDAVTPSQPAYTKVSLFPNIGNDADTVFYHWRALSNILNANNQGYFTKKVTQNNILSIEKSVVGIETVLPDSTFNIMFKIVATNKSNTATLNNIGVSDNLANAFPAPTIFKVSSVHAVNNYLAISNSFKGYGADTLLVTNGSLNAGLSDTIYLLVNVNLNGSGVYSFKNMAYGGLSNAATGLIYNVLDTSSATFNISPLTVFIPDGFSPNGDGINDTYVIGHTANQSIDLLVFNRWGNIVYKENNYRNDWNGKGVGNFLGKDLEDGTYYVVVTIHDTQKGISKIIKSITLRHTY